MPLNRNNIVIKMLWDMPMEMRGDIAGKIIADPVYAFKDNDLLIKALSSLSWYELVSLTGINHLYSLLTDDVIRQLYPEGRRKYYINARELLSKYCISPAG